MGITDLMVGGMGTLGKAVGEGVDAYRTEQDWKNLQQANVGGDQTSDPMVDKILALAKQGVDPRQAVELIRQERAQAPQVNTPGLNQGRVVMNAVPMQSANPLGSLGAPPAAPSQPAMTQPSAPQPMQREVGLPGMNDFQRPQSLPPLDYGPAPQQGQPQAPPAAQSATPQAAPQQAPAAPRNAMGLKGEITPRNFQLAQFLAQQRGNQRQANLTAATDVARESIKGAAGMEKEQFKALARQELEQYKAEARANVVGGQLEARLKQFDVQNQTNIWREYMDLQAKMAAIKQSGINSERRDSMLKVIYQKSSDILAKNGAYRGLDPALDALLDQMDSIRQGIELSQGVVTKNGPDEAVPGTPGVKLPIVGEVGGTPPTTKPGKPKTTVGADRRKQLGLE